MTFEARIASYLAHSSITALVGTRAGPVSAGEQPDLPYVAWQRISTTPDETHDVGSTLEEIVVQFSIFASTYASAVTIRRALRSVIEGNHSAGAATYSNAQDLGVDDSLPAYGISCDFTVWHDDSTA